MSKLHDQEEINNSSHNEHFLSVVSRSLDNPQRRHLIQGGLGLTALSALPVLSACGGGGEAAATPAPTTAVPIAPQGLRFESVAKNLLDDVTLPAGYSFKVLHATGDRINASVPAYTNLGTETDDWSARVGDHHDGMDIFFIAGTGAYSEVDTGRAVLAVNHESSADAHFFHPKGQTSGGVNGKKFNQFGGWDLGARTELEALKEINQHGVSLLEITRQGNTWSVNTNSTFNRRVTAQSLMSFAGPAAHLADIRKFMVTQFDPTGASSRGTLNNCGHGKTPWGTFLACEENWATYFIMPKASNPVDAKTQASRQRYGVARVPLADAATSANTQGWHTVSNTDNRFTRWDVSARGAAVDGSQDFRNEPNTFGFVVEIDPLRPNDVPIKRTALGRFAHEAAVVGTPKAGEPLAFYMGCDSQNEYFYKFVSTAAWDPADVGRGLAAGNKYLNEGKLYVAKFNDTGAGQWLELNINNPAIANYTTYVFSNQADVLINARHAADALGATKMDRPEWAAVNYTNGEVYLTLTNNTSRTTSNVDAANPRAYDDVDGRRRTGNPNGHIIRLRELDNKATALVFQWDVFLFGAEEDAGPAINLSGLNANNDFSSPDGLWFSKASNLLWIQTDDGNYTDVTNCMLLVAMPGTVGDGKKTTVNNTQGTNMKSVDTFIGATLGDTRLRRFLTGPKGCEVTGLTESPDGKTLFVNIQHPGENTPAIGTAADFTFESRWPTVSKSAYGPGARPRSATIVITKDDGGVVGL